MSPAQAERAGRKQGSGPANLTLTHFDLSFQNLVFSSEIRFRVFWFSCFGSWDRYPELVLDASNRKSMSQLPLERQG